jgi:serine/threonine protein kinase
MGQVRLGLFEIGRPPIVIKSVDPIATPEEECFRQEALAREGTMLWINGGHPNIVRYEGCNKRELYMEYVPGQTAAEQLARAKSGRLSCRTAVRIAIDTSRGLQHLHELGIVHRDIKTENIITQDDGTTKILDLGFAAVFEESADPNGIIAFGTPMYMSPEQARAQLLDGRSDIFSLGITLLEMLTGTNPFYTSNDGTEIISNIITKEVPESLVHRLPRKLQNILSKMLAKYPAERYQTCDDLIRDLTRALPYAYLQDYLDIVTNYLADGLRRVKGFFRSLQDHN